MDKQNKFIHYRSKYAYIKLILINLKKRMILIQRNHMAIFNHLVVTNPISRNGTSRVKMFNLLGCVFKSIPNRKEVFL